MFWVAYLPTIQWSSADSCTGIKWKTFSLNKLFSSINRSWVFYSIKIISMSHSNVLFKLQFYVHSDASISRYLDTHYLRIPYWQSNSSSWINALSFQYSIIEKIKSFFYFIVYILYVCKKIRLLKLCCTYSFFTRELFSLISIILYFLGIYSE